MNHDNSLLAIERQRRILEVLQRQGAVRTAELTKLMKVSAVTIRSDLGELQKLGECEIIWGGAVFQDAGFRSRLVIAQAQRTERGIQTSESARKRLTLLKSVRPFS